LTYFMEIIFKKTVSDLFQSHMAQLRTLEMLSPTRLTGA
jgi:hypothetical protein